MKINKLVYPKELEFALSRYYPKKKIVFTNGCFDIIHAGHVNCLEKAKALGDVLVVGLNSDKSIQQLKGFDRPINSEIHRAYVLSALYCIDFIILFDELTPENLIQFIEPDVMVKGSDYEGQLLPGEEFVKSKGGKVELIPILERGCSTTLIINKIKGIP